MQQYSLLTTYCLLLTGTPRTWHFQLPARLQPCIIQCSAILIWVGCLLQDLCQAFSPHCYLRAGQKPFPFVLKPAVTASGTRIDLASGRRQAEHRLQHSASLMFNAQWYTWTQN